MAIPEPGNANPNDGMDELVCIKDDVKVDANDPRCLHPSSQCRFREWCRVREAALAAEKLAAGRDSHKPDGAKEGT